RLPEHRQKYLDNRKEYLNERQETHKKELDELYKKVEKLQEEKTQVAAQINETNDSQEKAKLQAQLASLENQIKDVKGQISKKEKQVANDEKAIDDLFKEISNDTSLTPEQVQRLFSVETVDDTKELDIKRKGEESRIKLRELELNNEKAINEKNQETLLEIEKIRAKAKEANQESNPEVKKEKKEEIKKDWQEVKRMIEENNKMIVDSIGEKTSKLEEQQVQIAADLKDARQKGDKRAEQIALKAMAEVNKKLGLVKGVATNLITGKDIDELAQTTDQPWYQKIGNYFVGGECNYGGQHKMSDDLRQINKNFRAFDVLVKKQAKISRAKNEKDFNEAKNKLLTSFQELKKKCEDEAGAGFFYGSCIGLDGNKGDFSERIKSTFRRLAKELGYYIEEKDPVKKARLFAALSQKNQAIKSLQVELRKDPVYDLFSAEKSEELSNIVRNIFQSKPNTSFFTWKRKEEEEAEKVSESKKYLGFISQEA
ncbi:3867_t:CDS:2, partial [Racocetra persica]